LKEEIWQKRRFLKKDMIWLKGISILVIFISIKDIHPRERRRNKKKVSNNKKEIEDLKSKNYA
jgi:hypothetical protein